ncbi:XdhC/CoxI family protein [bacterium CPR1]|nr:XdhC/CoxI family protein [bacterium CPR1]
MRYADGAPQEQRLYFELERRLGARRAVAVATVVRAWGSTPREVGAKMLVDADGSIAGTIGGGCGEAEVWQEAQEVLTDGRTREVHVDLTEALDTDDGKVCGGRLDVLVDLWSPEHKHLSELIRRLTGGLEQGGTVAVLTRLGPSGPPAWKSPRPTDPRAGERLLYLSSGELHGTLGAPELDAELLSRLPGRGHRVESVGGVDVFVELLEAPAELIIAGAGHIARPLTRMATLCGYEVTVVDDREAFAAPRWFPEAARVICRPFAEVFEGLEVTARTHIVLVTRGHKHDEECLRAVLHRPWAYLGMIGSRRRTGAVLADLAREGVCDKLLARIHAPIGLDIGAETPEEIAVAILAELIKVRRGGQAASLQRRPERSREQQGRTVVTPEV